MLITGFTRIPRYDPVSLAAERVKRDLTSS